MPRQQALLLFSSNWKLTCVLANDDQEIAGVYDEFDRDDIKLYNSADLLAADCNSNAIALIERSQPRQL